MRLEGWGRGRAGGVVDRVGRQDWLVGKATVNIYVLTCYDRISVGRSGIDWHWKGVRLVIVKCLGVENCSVFVL